MQLLGRDLQNIITLVRTNIDLYDIIQKSTRIDKIYL